MLSKPLNPWWTVAAGAVGTAFGAGIFVVYLLGVFSKPMMAELGLDRSVIAFGLTCFLIATGFGSVSLGVLINRFGVRGPAAAFVTLTSVCVCLLSIAPPLPLVIYATFSLLGFFGAAATALPYSVSIAGQIDKRRGLALGLTVAGGGFGATFGPQFARILMEEAGWRAGILTAGLLMFIPAIGIALLVRTPKSVVAEAGVRTGHWEGYLKHRAFWLIGVVIVGVSIATYGVLATFVPLATDRGVTLAAAAGMLSVAGLSSWGGRIACGWLLDRMWAPLLTSIICFGVLVGIVLILVGGSNPLLLTIGAALNGLAMGAEADILAFLLSRYFGMQMFSRAIGSLWVAWAWGGGIGTAAAGLAYRATQSYNASLQIFCVVMAVAGAVVLFLGPYRQPSAPRPTGAAD